MESSSLFGVYGYPKHFLESALGKKREGIFQWLHELNLNAVLLDWTYGITMREERIQTYVKLAQQYQITVLLRAPKDIDLITENEKKRKHGISQLGRAVRLAKKLRCKDIIVSFGNTPVFIDRTSLQQRLQTELRELLEKNQEIRFHFEPALKRKEYGSLEELLSLCQNFSNAYPSFNLMKLHGYNGCNLIYPDRILRLFKQVEQVLGTEALSFLKVQICPVSYEHGRFIPKTFGEIKTGQLSFFDSNFEYFPKASDYIKTIQSLRICPITISTTPNTEELGAMRLRDSYFYHQQKREDK